MDLNNLVSKFCTQEFTLREICDFAIEDHEVSQKVVNGLVAVHTGYEFERNPKRYPTLQTNLETLLKATKVAWAIANKKGVPYGVPEGIRKMVLECQYPIDKKRGEADRINNLYKRQGELEAERVSLLMEKGSIKAKLEANEAEFKAVEELLKTKIKGGDNL